MEWSVEMKRNAVHVGWRLLGVGSLAGALALALGLLAPGLASAHAYAVSSDPPIGSTVKTAPSVVTVTFAENVNPQGSDILIYDVTGKQVSTGPAQVSRSNEKMMTVPLTADGDGVYLVQWHTVSADDGDPDIGAFNFTVDHTAKVAVATPTTSTTTPAGGGSSGAPVWLTVLLALVGLAVGGGAGYALARRAK
jgi:methionine-rich copper-binding protein CopC